MDGRDCRADKGQVRLFVASSGVGVDGSSSVALKKHNVIILAT